eukprot:SAG31_NODE_1318_length_8823_cov_3.108780_4_plen_180_part_00
MSIVAVLGYVTFGKGCYFLVFVPTIREIRDFLSRDVNALIEKVSSFRGCAGVRAGAQPGEAARQNQRVRGASPRRAGTGCRRLLRGHDCDFGPQGRFRELHARLRQWSEAVAFAAARDIEASILGDAFRRLAAQTRRVLWRVAWYRCGMGSLERAAPLAAYSAGDTLGCRMLMAVVFDF